MWSRLARVFECGESICSRNRLQKAPVGQSPALLVYWEWLTSLHLRDQQKRLGEAQTMKTGWGQEAGPRQTGHKLTSGNGLLFLSNSSHSPAALLPLGPPHL